MMRFVMRHVKRLAIFSLSVAATLVGGVVVTYVEMKSRYDRNRARGVPEGPPVDAMPDGEKAMEEISGRLEDEKFDPVRPEALGLLKALLNNSFLLLGNTKRSTVGHMYRYPEPFEEVVLSSFDGTPLAAVVGLHEDGGPRPGLVLSHGFMGSKHDHYIVETALTAFSDWGFNVLCIDLRNFGRSQCLSHTPTTAGWKEGEDILAAAKYLGEQPEVTTVGVAGFSMGAGSTLRAAYMNREYPYLTGGAIAWNGYADSDRMIKYISTRPDDITNPFYVVFDAFRLVHRLRRKDMLNYIDDPEIRTHLHKTFAEADFTEYIDKVTAPHYGVTAEEVYRNSSSKEYLADVQTPLLIVHAADDPVCPPSEMDELMEIAEENPNVHVWMLPAGNHCLFMYMDRNWYDTVMRNFFSYWAGWD